MRPPARSMTGLAGGGLQAPCQPALSAGWRGMKKNEVFFTKGLTSPDFLSDYSHNLKKENMKTVEPNESILNALDIFNAARRELVLELKQVGWTDEQAHKQIMNYQQTSWDLAVTFEQTKHEMDENEVYDWKGRKKITVTQKDLDVEA